MGGWGRVLGKETNLWENKEKETNLGVGCLPVQRSMSMLSKKTFVTAIIQYFI